MADQKSFLEMSDEELLAIEVPQVSEDAPAADAAVAAADNDDDEGAPAADEAAVAQPAAADADEDDAQDAGARSADAAQGGDEEAAKAEKQEEPVVTDKTPKAPKVEAKDEKPAPVEPKKDEKVEQKPTEIDYKAEYERLTAPFKANGRDIQVKSVDDAIALMQMGANYNKKMAGLKPNLKMLKMLENNGLLDEQKLSFLIDLDKKDPAAIKKLVKDSGLDPMGFDAEEAGKYQPKVHAVDEREIDLDAVLDDIKDSPAYSKTLAIVSKEWDGASKQIIASTPAILKVINDHVERGIFDIIRAEMESERMFGRLAGLSDIEAYRKVGDAINARGGFNQLGQSQKASNTGEIVQPKPKKADDEKLNEKRRAAAPTKPVAPTATPKDFNPLALSDEEFAKMAAPRYA